MLRWMRLPLKVRGIEGEYISTGACLINVGHGILTVARSNHVRQKNILFSYWHMMINSFRRNFQLQKQKLFISSLPGARAKNDEGLL